MSASQSVWDTVAAEVTTTVATSMEPTVRKVADDLYDHLMTTVQDYLADNVAFNIAASLNAASRGRRAEWERAEKAEKVNAALLEALKGLLANLTEGDFISETRIDAARAAITSATGEA
jgi:hypothetical protein